MVAALAGTIILTQKSAGQAGLRQRATILAEEGLEAARNIRDENFASLANGTYGVAVASNNWTFSGSQDLTENFFTRQVTVSTPATNRRQVVSTVTWPQKPQNGSVVLTTYLTNWLASAGVGNWSLPLVQGSYNTAGTQDGLEIFVSGNYAYLVTNNGTPDFMIFDISNLAAPSLVGSLSLVGTPMDVRVQGNYAYIANRDNGQELQVINVSNPAAPTQVFSYNANSTNDADALYIAGNYLYLARFSGGGREFEILSLSNPAAPSLVGYIDIGVSDTLYDVFVSGNYAYAVSGSDAQEIRVFDVSVPSAPTQISSVNLTGTSDTLSITGFTNRIIVGRTSGDIVLLDVTVPSTPLEISTLASSGSVFDLSIGNSNNYVWAASVSGTSEFKVIDITNQSSPSLLGSINLTGTLNGIFYDATLDRAFCASAIDTQELIIVQPS